MRLRQLHDWNVTPADAVSLQRQLAPMIHSGRPLRRIDVIAGADVSFNRFSNTIHAAVVVWEVATNRIIEHRTATFETRFPYRTGLLSFREAPAILAAFRKLCRQPDVVLIDGQGLAHPRRLGLASHVGLWLEIPTVGVAKSRLVGEFGRLGDSPKGSRPLVHRDEVVGTVMRTRRNAGPIFVSVGHRIDLATSVGAVSKCLRGRRLPEPIRLAHEEANELRRLHNSGNSDKLCGPPAKFDTF